MAKTDEKVMRMVEQELAKKPDASVDELFEKAKGMNAGVGRMTRRQFHARYPLQVKRRAGGGAKRRRKAKKGGRKAAAVKTGTGRPRGRPPRAAGADGRDAVRQVFLRFAQDVATAAQQPGALVKIILGVDRYVDEALKGR